MERDLVERADIPFVGIPGGGVHGVALRTAIRNGWELARAIFVARRLLCQESPAAVLTTGGYVSGPVALAARWERIPMLVFVPDIEPAQSIKVIAKLAQRVAVSVPASLEYFAKDKAVVTGYPLGERITKWDRAKGRAALGLDPEARVLLVFGGSRGARSINRALLAHVATLTDMADVVHITGTLDWPEVETARAQLPAAAQARYHAYRYLHARMGAALAAADLVVSRAGAGTLGEFPYFGLPAVLVPYPYAWRYQRVNASWLVDRAAAVMVRDEDLMDRLVPTVTALLSDCQRLRAMAEASRKLARPEAAHHLARLLISVGRQDESNHSSFTPGQG